VHPSTHSQRERRDGCRDGSETRRHLSQQNGHRSGLEEAADRAPFQRLTDTSPGTPSGRAVFARADHVLTPAYSCSPPRQKALTWRLPTRQVPADGAEVRRRRPRACGRRGPYPTVLGPAAPAAWPTRGRIVDARPPQWPGRVSRRLPRRGRRTASLPQASPLRACSQIVGSCHSRASKDGRQRYAAVVHGQRKSPLSCGFVHKPWTTPLPDLALGAGGRRFKSGRPDHQHVSPAQQRCRRPLTRLSGARCT
jgi:hypothetical protein